MLGVPRAGKFVPRQRSVARPGLFLAPSWCLAEAGSWFWRVLGFGGLSVLAGCNFSKGYFQAAGLRLKQLPVSAWLTWGL